MNLHFSVYRSDESAARVDGEKEQPVKLIDLQLENFVSHRRGTSPSEPERNLTEAALPLIFESEAPC